ncbi:MAG: Gfo/Idh/MocA family oxidoreductase [Chloroherpetonaceae bacterium]|nr:Gfo/Idh/MocA family oxidoreductase [Chthonomonadaceae bacterium]MDW8207817.1 Gfo/Idh/MocA family oxidoreductase [Chloroherpetonaceae bacterium]
MPDAADTAVVRLGVIGAGWFASRRHLPDAQKRSDVILTALCRRDPEARTRMATHFHVPAEQTYAEWERMLDQAPLDAVLIATPNNLHYTQAKAALERGLHVLLEKPMTIRSAEAWELVALAQQRGLQLAVALNPPYWAHCHRIRQALRKPEMGQLESATMYWTGNADVVFGKAPPPENLPGVVPPTLYRADPEQNGGGYFIDGGSHLVSEVLWVTGLRATRVSALMDATPMDMRTALALELDNGAIATITAIGNSAFPNRRVRNVFGATGGTITVSGFEFDTTIQLHGQEAQRFREESLIPVSTPIGNFVEAIQGKAQLYSPGEHGAHVVEVMEAAYASATTGQTVTLRHRSEQDGP